MLSSLCAAPLRKGIQGRAIPVHVVLMGTMALLLVANVILL